ncbi:MAG: glycosyltransferase family 4 protein [Limisphaerales bacterium]
MKVLFDHPNPFLLAHGGFQTQIEQTKFALQNMGLDVEYLRWFDDAQRGDIIHYFGRPSRIYIEQCHDKGIKVVIAELLSNWGSRTAFARNAQKVVMRLAEKLCPPTLLIRLAWDSYQIADACVVLTPWEAHIAKTIFRAPPERVHVVPNGVEALFFNSKEVVRGKYLVCTATITPRKRVLELARAAVIAQTPVWILGKPYSESDPYAREFMSFAAKHPDYLRYEGAVGNRQKLAEIYRQSRGFVLLSEVEGLSLSALEAAGCGCPLLLSDLPWARTTFGLAASYCPVMKSIGRTAEVLKDFYLKAPEDKRAFKPKSWKEIGEQLASIYERLLSTSR